MVTAQKRLIVNMREDHHVLEVAKMELDEKNRELANSINSTKLQLQRHVEQHGIETERYQNEANSHSDKQRQEIKRLLDELKAAHDAVSCHGIPRHMTHIFNFPKVNNMRNDSTVERDKLQEVGP